MKRSTLLLILLAIAVCNVNAQRSIADSIRYYEHALQHQRIESARALRTSPEYVADSQQLVHYADLSKGYYAYVLYCEVDGANFNAFNQGLGKDGFPPFGGAVFRPGLGFSYKANSGVIVDINLFSIGFNKTSESGGNKVKTSYSDLLQVQFGYAVVNARAINVYPYAGLSLRSSGLSYNATGTSNPNYNSIASLVQNNASGSWSTDNLSYQAGLAVDLRIAQNKQKLGGTMVFLKFGTDGIFGTETYKIDGIHYSPGIAYGQWMAAVGFKFYGKI